MFWHQSKVKKVLANVGICLALSSCNNTQDICRHISKTVYNENISTKQYFSYRKKELFFKGKNRLHSENMGPPSLGITGQIFFCMGKLQNFIMQSSQEITIEFRLFWANLCVVIIQYARAEHSEESGP